MAMAPPRSLCTASISRSSATCQRGCGAFSSATMARTSLPDTEKDAHVRTSERTSDRRSASSRAKAAASKTEAEDDDEDADEDEVPDADTDADADAAAFHHCAVAPTSNFPPPDTRPPRCEKLSEPADVDEDDTSGAYDDEDDDAAAAARSVTVCARRCRTAATWSCSTLVSSSRSRNAVTSADTKSTPHSSACAGGGPTIS